MLLFSFIIFSIFIIDMFAGLIKNRPDIAFVNFVGILLSMVEMLVLVA